MIFLCFSPTSHPDQRLALKRLIDISMGVITPLSEQLTKPLPNAMVLVNFKELSTGAHKLLPQGAAQPKFLIDCYNRTFQLIAQTSFEI